MADLKSKFDTPSFRRYIGKPITMQEVFVVNQNMGTSATVYHKMIFSFFMDFISNPRFICGAAVDKKIFSSFFVEFIPNLHYICGLN